MHHIGECLSKTQTRPRHILNWASVRSSSVAYSTSSCVRLKILAKLLNASNILFIFQIFASISMDGLVSLTCSALHLQSPCISTDGGRSAVQWCRSLAGGTTWQRSRSPAQRRPPWPRYLVQRGNRSLDTCLHGLHIHTGT